jgi:hypothetical protein
MVVFAHMNSTEVGKKTISLRASKAGILRVVGAD